jgi:hypothetical protein
MKEANKIKDAWLLDICQNYTKLIINQGVPKIINKDCRYIFAVMTNQITPFPGLYRIPLNQYVMLDEQFKFDIRLPTFDEIEENKINNDVVVFHDHVYNKCPLLLNNSLSNIFNLNCSINK